MPESARHAHAGDGESEPQGTEQAGDGFAPNSGPPGEGDNAGRKRRRRGKRGGRRRGRGDGNGRSPGEDSADFAHDEGTGSTHDEGAPVAAAEQVEIVHQPLSSGEGARQGIETAFTTAPLRVSEESLGTAEAPVMDAGEALHDRQPPLFPVMNEPVASKEEPQRAMAQTEESGTAPAQSGAPTSDAKLVTEKPVNPKRGWWQRLIDS
jgi:ribonuclease E